MVEPTCDIPVDSEAPVVTSSILNYAGPVFEGAHRARMCVYVHNMCALWALIFILFIKKNKRNSNLNLYFYIFIPKF